MKKVCIICLALFLFPAVALSAPSYGTRMPAKNKFFMGGQTHYIHERKLEQDHGEIQSLQHFLLLSYGIEDWLSLDLKGGCGNAIHRDDYGNRISYPTYVGGGYGFRLKLYEHNDWKITFGFQHISIHPYSIKIGPTKNKAVIDDWQLSTLVSHPLGKTLPYLGMKWSRTDLIHWVEDERNRKKSDLTKSIGLIVGWDVDLTDKTWLNVEGQFFDVQAYSVSINVRF